MIEQQIKELFEEADQTVNEYLTKYYEANSTPKEKRLDFDLPEIAKWHRLALFVEIFKTQGETDGR